jgi:hypothetical protein
MSKKLSPAGAVFAWNSIYPIGTIVNVTKDNGEVVRTKTRSKAELFNGRSAVIWLDGITGCYLLNRVKVAS